MSVTVLKYTIDAEVGAGRWEQILCGKQHTAFLKGSLQRLKGDFNLTITDFCYISEIHLRHNIRVLPMRFRL